MNPPVDVLHSVVVPVYNEQENLRDLNTRLVSVLQRCGAYEIIYVDDGSTDGSFKDLIKLYKAYPELIVLIKLSVIGASLTGDT